MWNTFLWTKLYLKKIIITKSLMHPSHDLHWGTHDIPSFHVANTEAHITCHTISHTGMTYPGHIWNNLKWGTQYMTGAHLKKQFRWLMPLCYKSQVLPLVRNKLKDEIFSAMPTVFTFGNRMISFKYHRKWFIEQIDV